MKVARLLPPSAVSVSILLLTSAFFGGAAPAAPVSYVFKKGHRIRVSLTGADYRERDRQSVEPAPTVTIYDSARNPSSIALPVMPRPM
jgi:hypothetical protein